MLAALLVAAQAATAQPPADISLHATVEARSVKVEKKGKATIAARAEPDGGSTATSSGTRQGRRFELQVDARIAAAQQAAPPEETPAQPPR